MIGRLELLKSSSGDVTQLCDSYQSILVMKFESSNMNTNQNSFCIFRFTENLTLDICSHLHTDTHASSITFEFLFKPLCLFLNDAGQLQLRRFCPSLVVPCLMFFQSLSGPEHHYQSQTISWYLWHMEESVVETKEIIMQCVRGGDFGPYRGFICSFAMNGYFWHC